VSPTGSFLDISVLGEYKFQDLTDNSQSDAYQDANHSAENNRFMSWAINRRIYKVAI
jgi:hypothetical protein